MTDLYTVHVSPVCCVHLTQQMNSAKPWHPTCPIYIPPLPRPPCPRRGAFKNGSTISGHAMVNCPSWESRRSDHHSTGSHPNPHYSPAPKRERILARHSSQPHTHYNLVILTSPLATRPRKLSSRGRMPTPPGSASQNQCPSAQ